MKKLLKINLILLLLFLTSCVFGNKDVTPLPPVKIITEIIEPELYAPPLPREVQIENIRWYVLTRDNIEEKMTEIESTLGESFVVFAMTPQSYENMAFNLQSIKRYIKQSQEIILYFMEATAPQGRAGWLAETQARRDALEEATEPEPEIPDPPALFGVGDLFKLF